MASLLRARPLRRGQSRPFLAKIMRSDTIADFSDAYLFDMTPLEFESFDDMAAVVDGLRTEPEFCVIRGDVVRPGPSQRRLLRDQPNGDKATIVPRPGGQQWVMLDIDKRPAEGNLTTNQDRLDFLISKLPPEFHDTTYYYKWSSKAGRGGDWQFLSCHFWFWLDQPITDANLHKRSQRGGDWFNLVDPAVFTPNQIHYTAQPIFDQIDDPCEGFRAGIVRGDRDAVPIEPWIEPYRPRPVFTPRQMEDRSPGRQTDELLNDIGAPFYHEAIRKVIANYVAVVPTEKWDQDDLFFRIKMQSHARSYVDQHYLSRLWDGAVTKYKR